MGNFLKWMMRGVALSVLVLLALALLERDRITRLLAVNSLFSEEKIVVNFITMDQLFATVDLRPTTDRINRLATAAPMDMPAGFMAWTQDRAVTGVIVLKDGIIRHESYPLTAIGEDDPAQSRRISWSVAKSFLSVLMGVLHENGTIPDLDAPVTDYAPTLAGSAYANATIRNVLQMASGVTFDEDYLDFWSDINKMGRVLALGQSMDRFTETLSETSRSAGERWQYVSIDTHVLAMVIRGATNRTLPDLMNEFVITPLAPTRPPYYLTDGHGVAFALAGLNLTTHDYALFGHMVASGGVAFGKRIVSEDWIEESTRPSAPTAARAIGYGYQWWIPTGSRTGQFMARGIYGQYIYIDRGRGVVIAVNGADRNFRQRGASESNIAMFRAIAESFD